MSYKKNAKVKNTNRREFFKKAGKASIAVGAASTLAAPAIVTAKKQIRWRFQTYAGSALGQHVTKPAIDMINEASDGELKIELFYADQLVPLSLIHI